MRLTLRTLLAWLDDTLSPSEVREIGKQVEESPFAKELVDKIHLVTRQRRLTVPPSKGPEAVDANVVAAYLDNELEPEQVAELEKRCLISDVHLAEVASVHQVLSLIGQKAKVPIEARHRMYQLIKGREAVKPEASRASRQTEPRPVVEPVQPWISPPPPERPLIERFGPPALVAGLMFLLCWAAWKTLSTAEPVAVAPMVAQAIPTPPPTIVKPVAPPAEPKAPAPDETAEAEKAKARAADDAEAAASDANKAPSGSVGLAKNPNGVLLRYDTEHRDWQRLLAATPLRDQDRLLNLEPFRNTLELGTATVDLAGETEVWARATLPNFAARLTLAQGRVVLHGTAPSLPFEILFSGKAIKVIPPPGGIVGIERINRRAPGESKAAASVLRFHAADAPLKLDTGAGETTLDDVGAVTVEADGSFSETTVNAPPHWVTETEPVAYDKDRGELFLKFLPPDQPILKSLVEASEDEEKEVDRLAIAGLHAVGDLVMIVPLLNDKGRPSAAIRRRKAGAVLREFLARGPESSRDLRAQLDREFGDEEAAVVEKLLVGYTLKEAGDEATYARLVQLLGKTDSAVGVRQLALDDLMELTGRDDLDYDPENPARGKGLKAWKDLLNAKELKPAAAARKAG